MQSSTYYTIMAGLGALGMLGAVGKYVWSSVVKAISFFTGMDSTVKETSSNVKTIMNNHLPHIYSELGELKGRLDAGEN